MKRPITHHSIQSGVFIVCTVYFQSIRLTSQIIFCICRRVIKIQLSRKHTIYKKYFMNLDELERLLFRQKVITHYFRQQAKLHGILYFSCPVRSHVSLRSDALNPPRDGDGPPERWRQRGVSECQTNLPSNRIPWSDPA